MSSSAVIADVPRDLVPQTEPGSVLASGKLQPWHLERRAVVYVRQSSPQQVLENRESTARQYALVDRAMALGWPPRQSHVQTFNVSNFLW